MSRVGQSADAIAGNASLAGTAAEFLSFLPGGSMDGAPVAAASAPAAPAFRAFHSHGMWTEGFILP